MPLPFLKPKPQMAGIATVIRPSDSPEQDKDDNGLEACAQDIIDAFNANDAKSLAAAIKAAYQICETYPDEEQSENPEMDNQE